MPTPLDKALNSKNLFMGFAAIVTAATAWSIWGGDMFPQDTDSKGEPETWTDEQLRRYLVRRNLSVSSAATREELLSRVQDIKKKG